MSIFSLTILLIWPYFGPKRGKKKKKKKKKSTFYFKIGKTKKKKKKKKKKKTKKKSCPFYFRPSFKSYSYFAYLLKITTKY